MLVLKPPRCLGAFLAHRTTDPGIDLDSLVEEWENHFFSLACPCGGTSFTVRSFIDRPKYIEEDRAYGPITLQCSTCNSARAFFDPALHGYDVEIDHFPEPGPYPGTLREYGCPNCSARTFALIARFQYPDNVLEPHKGAGSYVPASEDLFTYFTLLGTCDHCEATVTISSVECA
jgi:hypothetical protein